MSPVNEFERGFAFTDAADARKQHADAVDVQESSVYSGFRRKKIVQEIDDIVDALSPSFTGTSKESIKNSIQKYIAIDSWNSTPVMTEVAYNNLIKVMKNAGSITETVPFASVVNNSYALAVLSESV